MKKTIILSCFIIILGVVFLFIKMNSYKSNYTTSIISYTENGSYIEHPHIDGLKDKELQDSINKLLKDQVLLGAKTFDNKTFVDFSELDSLYEFSSGIGLTNQYIASFWYAFDMTGKNENSFTYSTYRVYCITIDMKTGKKIELPDFMVIDERLIYSDDGTGIETNYNSAANPTYHNFKDAFSIYSSEEGEDAYHYFTIQEAIDWLSDIESETGWYIDEDKNIHFVYDKMGVSIPYVRISDAIYPKYLEAIKY